MCVRLQQAQCVCDCAERDAGGRTAYCLARGVCTGSQAALMLGQSRSVRQAVQLMAAYVGVWCVCGDADSALAGVLPAVQQGSLWRLRGSPGLCPILRD